MPPHGNRQAAATTRRDGSNEDLPDAHVLRAGDAAPLAAALVWCRERPKQRPLIAFDDRLRTAAAALGLSVRP
jgi:hypothetical protein